MMYGIFYGTVFVDDWVYAREWDEWVKEGGTDGGCFWRGRFYVFYESSKVFFPFDSVKYILTCKC